MFTAPSFLKILPLFSFKSTTVKLPILPTTTKLSPPSSRRLRLLAESSFGVPREIVSGPKYRPLSVSPSPPEISKTPEVDPSDSPLEFTTGDPPPLGRPGPDPGPDFPKPPLGPPPVDPEVVPLPPPGQKPPPEVDPPPSTPPGNVPPPSIPPEIPTPSIPPDIPPPKSPDIPSPKEELALNVKYKL
ncbi:proline-rich receptor-like protein kinase PERK9 isoform X4 [Gossypium hirsutum]|uniref:Proline-rich receptor-like protein kinase PERK9 isoform X4 n=1 Tax=Gossypium hirsutum TaxID=3635 RepID=A0A1U8LMW8_GOSHI|nr:proline-rich receptor-like protein kinase PERK9 isoform X4 [Gossypium hirsutum]